MTLHSTKSICEFQFHVVFIPTTTTYTLYVQEEEEEEEPCCSLVLFRDKGKYF